MSTTFYGATFKPGGSSTSTTCAFRAKCVYDVTTSNTAVTVSGTIYLQHNGGTFTTSSYSYLAVSVISSSVPQSNTSSFVEGTFYFGGGSPYKVTPAVAINSVAAHSSWTDIKSASFSFSLAKGTSAKTYYLLSGTDYSPQTLAGFATAGQYKSISVPALTSYSITYNANGGSGAPSTQTKYYGQTLTLSSTKPTRTNYVFKNWNTKSDGTGTAYNPGATYTTNATLTLYAQWYSPYTVTYNANGGSGAPAQQTKVYGQALTLSSTKPTRTNYVFKNWNTKADGTGTTYSPGASYSSNANLTLYAQWYAPYTVTFNANGGTGGPTTQTKVYNTNLTLSTSKPTRSGFTFITWNTNANGTGTNYAPGATYSTNANLTIYAIWDATPSITSLTAIRCDSEGVDDDEGEYARVTCTWKVDNALGDTGAITGTITPQSGGSSTPFTFGTNPTGSGTVTSVAIVGSGNGMQLDTDMQYTVSVTVTNTSTGSTQSTSRNVILTRAFFTMDWKAGGEAIGIGRAAPDSGLEIGFPTKFDAEVRSYGNVIIDKDEPILTLRSNAQGGGYSGLSIRALDTGSAGNGVNAVIQSGGNMIIGGGESPMNLYNTLGTSYMPSFTSEDISICSDQYIRFYPNFNSGKSGAGYVLIDSNGSIILRGKPFGSTPVRASYYIDSPEFTIGTSAQNGITESKYMSLYFRDASLNWAGTVENQAVYESDSTAANAGAVRTYIQSRNMKPDGTRANNHFSVYVRKDGSLHYSCGSPTNLRSDFDLAQKSTINLYSTGQGSSSDVSMANDTSVNLGTYTISTAGFYIIFAYFRFATNATGFRQGIISTTSADNTAPLDRCTMVQAANGWQTVISVAYAVNVTSSTKYYFVGKQKSGGALTGNVYWRIVRLK